MSKKVQDLITQMTPEVNKVDTIWAAKVSAAISEEQAEAADKMERHTRKLIRLTWALVMLSVALLALTFVLLLDTHQLAQAQNMQKEIQPRGPSKVKNTSEPSPSAYPAMRVR